MSFMIWVKTRPSVLLLGVAVLLLTLGAMGSHFEVGFWGLIHSFSVIYFVGLGLVGISFIVALRFGKLNKILLFSQLLIFIIALRLIPVLIGGYPPGLPMAYRNLWHINNIAEQGVSYLGTTSNLYLSWPGLQVFFGKIVGWWGINLEPLFNVVPFIMALLYLPPLFVFFKNILGGNNERCCWVGLWLFTLGNWIGQDYFSPQAVALLFLLVIIVLATSPILREGVIHKKIMVAIVLLGLFGALAITHLLTSLAGICVLCAYAVVKKSPKLAIIVCLCILMVCLWDVSYGGNYIDRVVTHEPIVLTDPEVFGEMPTVGTPTVEMSTVGTPTVETPTVETTEKTTYEIMRRATEGEGILVLNPAYILKSNVLSSLYGSESHIAIVKVRIGFALMFAVLGILGVVYMLIYERKRENIAVMAMSILLLPLLSLRYGGWELALRVYMFELPFIAYFGAMLLSVRKKLVMVALCPLIVAGSMLFLVCYYGNQAVDYWSEDHKDGYDFVYDLRKETGCRLETVGRVDLVEGEVVFRYSYPTKDYYFIISKYDDITQSFAYARPDFVDGIWVWLRESPSHISVYKNPEFEVFKWVGE